MPYATVSDLANRAAFRGTYTNSTIPTASQVIGYILDASAQLDQWLLAGGYDAPFDQAIASGLIATSGQLLLRNWNTTGAALLVEQAAQQSDREVIYQKQWDNIAKMCMDKSIDVPLPMLAGKAHARAAGIAGSPAPFQPQEFTFDLNPRGRSGFAGSWDL